MGKTEGFLRLPELHEEQGEEENRSGRANERLHVRNHSRTVVNRLWPVCSRS